jgi:WD40 repeat protein
MITSLQSVGKPLNAYVSSSGDGTVKVWDPADMSHRKTLCHTAGQVEPIDGTRGSLPTKRVTAFTYMSKCNRLAVASVDRTVTFYDVKVDLHSMFEMCGRLVNLTHTILTMDYCVKRASEKSGGGTGGGGGDDAREFLIMGDDGGWLQVLMLGKNWHICDGHLPCHTDGVEKCVKHVFKQHIHTDWVTKVQFVPAFDAILTCSLDTTMKFCDLERKKVQRTFDRHAKGVYSFVWCSTYRFVASCGMSREILLWNPFTCRVIDTLRNHSAVVQHLCINDSTNQLFSLDVAKVINVWDVRTHKCLQTIVDKTQYRPENRITALIYDHFSSPTRLVRRETRD